MVDGFKRRNDKRPGKKKRTGVETMKEERIEGMRKRNINKNQSLEIPNPTTPQKWVVNMKCRTALKYKSINITVHRV